MENMTKLMRANQVMMVNIMKIVNGLWNGTVRLISNPNDGCLACEIGDYWFYFIGTEDENLKPEEVKQRYNVFTIASKILDAMLELDDNEYAYYRSILHFD